MKKYGVSLENSKEDLILLVNEHTLTTKNKQHKVYCCVSPNNDLSCLQYDNNEEKSSNHMNQISCSVAQK